MMQFFRNHLENSRLRRINETVDILHDGGVIAYHADAAYPLGLHISEKKTFEQI